MNEMELCLSSLFILHFRYMLPMLLVTTLAATSERCWSGTVSHFSLLSLRGNLLSFSGCATNMLFHLEPPLPRSCYLSSGLPQTHGSSCLSLLSSGLCLAHLWFSCGRQRACWALRLGSSLLDQGIKPWHLAGSSSYFPW